MINLFFAFVLNKNLKYVFLLFFVLCTFIVEAHFYNMSFNEQVFLNNAFTLNLPPDTIDLPFPFKDSEEYNPRLTEEESPLFLGEPENIEESVEYDPETNEFIVSKKAGSVDYRPSSRMTYDEYSNYQFEQSIRKYWKQRSRGGSGDAQSGLFPNLRLGGETFDKIFGSNVINIVPMGSAELIFGVNINKIDNPILSEDLRSTTTFDFKTKITMEVKGNVGDKIKLGIRYDTEATFDFENQTKLEYVGKEDEIIKRIEAGNVTLPLPGSLITGSQSLFGIKTEMQFGNLTVTSVFSQQKGETKVINVKGGAQSQTFEIGADEYEANKHFFLSHFFKNNYDDILKNLPIVNSPYNITRVEVWVTNKTNNFEENRNILALLDLAEADTIFASPDIINPATIFQPNPANNTNGLYDKLYNLAGIRDINQIQNVLRPWEVYNYNSGQDFEKIENARKLKENEYTINERLGYISLNSALNSDEVLAVAYEYYYNGERFQVGEFSTDGLTGSSVLLVKLLKGTTLTPSIPTWDLMMKNVYAIGAYQVNSDDFILDVLYQDDKTGNAINFIPDGKINKKILLKVLNLDNLNSQLDESPDGRFDFIEGTTVNSSNGRIIFPVLQPFGSYLREAFGESDADQIIADKYVFQELYDTTITYAKLVAEKNKFLLRGEYRSAVSSEISLSAINIPQGSVVVTAGGRKLTENIEYTVDYNLGRVRIIDAGLLESGTPIQVSLESNALYSIQSKTLIGTHLNYRISDDFNIGGTVINLTERPLTQKVAIGEEPISNTIWGLNTSYRTESQFLTTLVDYLPFLETKEKSAINFDAEFAHLIPGHSDAIEEEGNAYIDDFEGSETSFDIRTYNSWVLSSIPQGQSDLFPEANADSVASGYNRAKIAWYKIDPLFLRNSSLTPGHIKSDPEQQSSHFVREIFEQEIFPNKESETQVPTALQVLNLAYYPRERGPYNFTTNSLNADGTLSNPEERWAGIMREMPQKDFETSNVEYIEFWLMDPFVYDSLHTGGELYFNLGNISEDILKDSRKSFENGLPNSAEVIDVDTTAWGRVPSNQSIVDAFDLTQANARKYQDAGLDGLTDSDEQQFFNWYLTALNAVVSTDALQKIENDPSADNYHYYRGGDYDAEKVSILNRYKNFNNHEGNSPTDEQSPEGYPTSATNEPDVEDIDSDNTLSETESYFQYKVELRPNMMRVGENNIVDKRTATVKLPVGEGTITWYQFRIPVREPERVVGAIQDFKSIRFMRMFMRDFEDSIILRFGKLELVRGEWRKYNLSLMEGHEAISTPEYSNGILDIASINIEENTNYVLPPGVDRVIDPTNPQLRQLNEQSMVLRIKSLDDGDARAAYKSLNLDIRQYKKLKLFVHAEPLETEILKDEDLRIFVRLGTDYRDNYYEYEIPLVTSNPGDKNRNSVWPDENNVEIILDELVNVKQTRNTEMQKANSAIAINSIFSVYDGNTRLTVRGNPNLSNVKTIMIGIRNPSKQSNILSDDDGMPKSGEIWVNELRLTDFKEDGGWAARARLSTRLADFGTVNVAGSMSTPGFGSIEKKVNERSKEEIIEYDLSTNLDLGKFFPEKAQVSIPMYAGYSEGFINPEYNPLDPDVPLKVALDNAASKTERDSIKNIAQDYTERKSLNFTNVKINKPLEKPRVYDPSNFSVSYSYNEVFSKNINTEYNIQKNYRGGINYNYITRPKNVTPFRKVKFFNNNSMALFRDFNFYYLPSSFVFRTDMYRRYQEVKTRNISNPDNIIEPTFSKDFTWNRYYDLKYDIARSLKLDFSAQNVARIDEPYGIVDKNRDRDSYEHWKDSVWNNIKNFGRNTQYNQNINLTYTVPINKIPLFDWVNASARYNGTYNWDAGPVLKSYAFERGNTIRNSRTYQLNGQTNLLTLYNKVGFLKKINQKYSSTANRKKSKKLEAVTYREEKVSLKANRSKTINHELLTEDITVKVIDKNGKDIKGEVEIISKNKVKFKPEIDADDVTISVQGKIEKKENPFIFIAENTALLLMSVKNISVSYSVTEGSSISGYKPSTSILGMENAFESSSAPGWPYVFGWQDEDFVANAIKNGWYTDDTTMINPYLMTQNKSLNIRATLEPIIGLKIELTANRSSSENNSRYYLPTDSDPYNQQVSGNFSMSYLTILTAFEKVDGDNNYYSQAFEDFKNYRSEISNRLASKRVANPEFEYDPNDPHSEDGAEYKAGYGSLSQEVMIPAFLSAYGISDKNKISLDVFQKIPLPNWNIRFDRLKDIPFLKRYFKSINISHAYRSTYNIGTFINSSEYKIEDDGYSYVVDAQNNFIPEYNVSSVSINEQFAPLINIDMTWVNNLTTRFEMKKSRTITLSFTNNQITEVYSDEMGISLGYRFDNFNLIFDFGNQQENFKSDLNLRANLKIRDNKTVLREIAESTSPQPPAGQSTMVVGISADYMLSDRLTLRIFYDLNTSTPYVSSSYPTSNTNVGFSLRFTLTQ
ncbi:MAG: cell surface protein SprA [Bacteroidetes bacterium GWC2_33_15]|nr:MAG: cell surface protein SprA [Bacteroidetes bacterium GWA2_33_15]OFX49344.1 MAG: cell surface protein SprA [Bacteroidetes bacterium GWC2_33_15]OFX63063.1 MAG: cell surface protein SprA [Bacteroidetes bacterium GWB2_32_14]OFX68692.1 MAG: cell surface protein SprA [Bacteroidetes bacterium GWD2_33_33]HAN19142.1 cell surface protein SprA [Bacteroidales bacterium]